MLMLFMGSLFQTPVGSTDRSRQLLTIVRRFEMIPAAIRHWVITTKFLKKRLTLRSKTTITRVCALVITETFKWRRIRHIKQEPR